jgi:hypothetical protein
MLCVILKTMKLIAGDIYRIKTKLGFAFFQYFETSEEIEYIRVLATISEGGNITQEEIDRKERWTIGFPVKAATRKKIIERIGNFGIPENFTTPKYARTPHNIRGEHLGWHIVDRNTWNLQLKTELDEEDLEISPWGIWNDTLLIERLEGNWSLSDWK